MTARRASEWRRLPVSLSELSIDTTLRCGQSFRWSRINDEWTCAIHGRVLSLKQDPFHLHYRVTWPDASPPSLAPPPPSGDVGGLGSDDTEELLRRYFSLDLDLGALYRQWAEADPNFRRKAPAFAGVRILSQDAWEALICFICSSNNNISRISQMVHKLCKSYGEFVGTVGGQDLHDFPTPGSLTGKQVESHLRELGFGYRAKYIAETARVVALERPAVWLESLRNPNHHGPRSWDNQVPRKSTYKEAHEELLSLTGVGPKVADCVCLMGLGWGESVPVDTHVWQIAQRDYGFGKTKSRMFNRAMYDAVGDHFRAIWGDYAGWAHSVLFTADLREFSNQMPSKGEAGKTEGDGKAGGDAEEVVKAEEVKAEEGGKAEEGEKADDEKSLLVVATAGTFTRAEASAGSRKRSVNVKTEVRAEAHIRGEEEAQVLGTGGSPKRRRTRRHL